MKNYKLLERKYTGKEFIDFCHEMYIGIDNEIGETSTEVHNIKDWLMYSIHVYTNLREGLDNVETIVHIDNILLELNKALVSLLLTVLDEEDK